mgnify:CR=1 FL=1
MITTFIQKICTNGKSAFSFQGHPKASPGPHDVSALTIYVLRISPIINEKTVIKRPK